ncbi:MAG: stalk domain-containing protein [Clostridia bacterium]|nr:stalk domain-containing protein [Clostridia bacterium]
MRSKILLLLFIILFTCNATYAEEPMRLDVPNFVQHYQPWKDQQYGFGNRTIEYAGCALTSLSMLFKYYGVDTNPEDMNNWLKNNNGYVAKESISWSKAVERSAGKIQYIGTKDFNGKADLTLIKAEIDKGFPVMARMRYQGTNHYVLICGYSGDTFYINDPWTEDSSKTINEGYEPFNNPSESIKGIVMFKASGIMPPKVPVVKVGVSKFEKGIVDDFLPDVKFKEISLTIGDPMMVCGGERKPIDADGKTAPLIIDGRTYLPVRAILEEMGGTVEWEGRAKKIEILIGRRTIEMWVDKRQAFINGYPFPLETGPKIVNSKTMLPIRPIIEKLGCSIEWDAATRTVTIKSR